MHAERPLLTVSQVANRLRLSRQTIHALIKAGKIPAIRLGRSVRLLPTTIEEILQAGAISKGTR